MGNSLEASLPDNEALAASAMQAFEHVVLAAGDFSHRPGQHQMAQLVAHTLAQATLGEDAQPVRRIAVIQAGTGVGKSLAACVPAMTIALARNTRFAWWARPCSMPSLLPPASPGVICPCASTA